LDKKTWQARLFCLFSLLFLVSCSPDKKNAPITLSGPTMGTNYTVKYLPTANMPHRDEIAKEVKEVLAEIEPYFLEKYGKKYNNV